MIITSFRNQSQQYCYHTEHNNTWNHLVFLAETFSWSSFTSDQQISDDLFLQQILDDLSIKSKISENLFFYSKYHAIFLSKEKIWGSFLFQQIRKYLMIFFSNKSENIWWSSFLTNQNCFPARPPASIPLSAILLIIGQKDYWLFITTGNGFLANFERNKYVNLYLFKNPASNNWPNVPVLSKYVKFYF